MAFININNFKQLAQWLKTDNISGLTLVDDFLAQVKSNVPYALQDAENFLIQRAQADRKLIKPIRNACSRRLKSLQKEINYASKKIKIARFESVAGQYKILRSSLLAQMEALRNLSSKICKLQASILSWLFLSETLPREKKP